MILWSWLWRLAVGYFAGTAVAVALMGLVQDRAWVVVLPCLLLAGWRAARVTRRRRDATPPPTPGRW